MLQIALAQIQVHPGQPEKNFQAMVRCIQEAKAQHAHIILFPELCLSGYLIGDMWEDPDFISDCLYYGEELRRLSKDITILFGNVGIDPNRCNHDGRPRRYNAFYTAHQGEWKAPIHSPYPFAIKTLLPNYRLFHESRWFTSLSELAAEENTTAEHLLSPIFLTFPNGQHLTFAPLLCEDSWDENYLIHPLHSLCQSYSIDLAVNLSASPFTLGKTQRRHRLFADTLSRCRLPLLYVNCTGIQNNGKNIYTFDGSSAVYTHTGELIQEAEAFSETLVYLSFDPCTKSIVSKSVLQPPASDISLLFQSLRFGIQQFLRQLHIDKVVIGISGGIDSAVNAALYAAVLPPEHLLLVNIPSRYNSTITKDLAKKLAENLGCQYGVFPIETSVQHTIQQIETTSLFQGQHSLPPCTLSPLAKENIQARDRSSRILAGLAAAFGGVFTCNANKTELSIGYATLYGDASGFLAATADLWKGQIYELAHYLNEHVYHQEVIPQKTLSIVPSAELSSSQNIEEGKGDPLIYPYHDALFRAFTESWNRPSPADILDWYQQGILEEKLGTPVNVSALFPAAGDFIADLERWYTLLTGFSVAKRIQSPPVLSVSRRAFGNDRMESQLPPYFSRRYQTLKNKLLKGDLP